ncbi:hypothetical protein RTP6_003495 [Batrachochytrium dendrobatidis]
MLGRSTAFRSHTTTAFDVMSSVEVQSDANGQVYSIGTMTMPTTAYTTPIPTVFKIQFGNDIRLISAVMTPSPDSVNGDVFLLLLRYAAQTFHLFDMNHLAFKWQDHQGDWIVVSNEKDLYECVKWQSQHRDDYSIDISDFCPKLVLVFTNPVQHVIQIQSNMVVMHDMLLMTSQHISLQDSHSSKTVFDAICKLVSNGCQHPTSVTTATQYDVHNTNIEDDMHICLQTLRDEKERTTEQGVSTIPSYGIKQTLKQQKDDCILEQLNIDVGQTYSPIDFSVANDLMHLLECVYELESMFDVYSTPAILIHGIQDTLDVKIPQVDNRSMAAVITHSIMDSANVWGSVDDDILNSMKNTPVSLFDDDFAIDDFVIVDFTAGANVDESRREK